MEFEAGTTLILIGGAFVLAEMLASLSVGFFALIGVAFISSGLFALSTGQDKIGVIAAIISTTILGFIAFFVFYKKRKNKNNNRDDHPDQNIYVGESFYLNEPLFANKMSEVCAFGITWRCILIGEIDGAPKDKVQIIKASVNELKVKLLPPEVN